MTKVILIQRIVAGGRLLEKGTSGQLLGREHPAEWDGGAVLANQWIYLILFHNVESARGPVKVWLPDESLLILDGQHAPWETAE